MVPHVSLLVITVGGAAAAACRGLVYRGDRACVVRSARDGVAAALPPSSSAAKWIRSNRDTKKKKTKKKKREGEQERERHMRIIAGVAGRARCIWVRCGQFCPSALCLELLSAKATL